MKDTEKYFPVVLSVYYAVQGGSHLWKINLLILSCLFALKLTYMFCFGISEQSIMSPHGSGSRSVTENSLGVPYHSIHVND